MGFSLVVMIVVTQVPVEIDWEAEVDSPPPMVGAEVEVVPPMVAAVPEAQPPAPLPGPVAPNVVAPRGFDPRGGEGDAGVKAEVKKEAEEKKDAAPFWQVTALATANIPLSLDGAAFLYGLRGEIDVWRLSVVATFDRTGTTPFTMSETRSWNGLAGASVVATKNFRARLLGGVSALTTDTSAVFAPSAGATARVSWKFIGLEGAVTGSFGAFRQVDARAELVLQGGIVELHGGYRARLVEVKDGEGVLVAGPTVALGLSF
jgi:hypothetical protein